MFYIKNDFEVIVSNDNSNAVSSCALTVKLPALKIIKGLDNQNINVGEKALFSVETNGAPQIVKWYAVFIFLSIFFFYYILCLLNLLLGFCSFIRGI